MPQDFQQSFKWFKKAQEGRPDPELEMLIGCHYLAGLGVKQDPARAKEWLEKAAGGGDAHGAKALLAFRNGLNVDHFAGLSFLQSHNICSPIANSVIFDEDTMISPPFSPASDDTYGWSHLESVLANFTSSPSESAAVHSARGRRQPSSARSHEELYRIENHPAHDLPASEIVRLDEEAPTSDPAWFREGKGGGLFDGNVHVIYL